MALIAVLWIVAALSVMVTGVTSTVRQQIQVAGLQRDQASGQALGQAAIALALQAMQAAREPVPGVTSVSVPYAGQQIAVEVAPLNGLIPLNGAGADLLAALLRVAGGLAPAPAQALATALVEWRDGRPAGDAAGADARQRQFEAPEDLLLVPGVDYTLYARLRPLVTTDQRGGDRVNPLAAPPAVLAVLARGDAALAGRIVAQRAASAVGVDTTGLDPALAGSSGSTYFYRLVARVPLGEGKILGFTRDVALDSFSPRTAPWRTLRSERQLLAIDGA